MILIFPNSFVQAEVKTVAARCFGERFLTRFKIEVKVNPLNNKDVGYQFLS
ncbi:hypothetical protein QG516_20780 [Pedobacter gandavensis]|uniref:hypothetical protein n=1 Tax=Pedobacter gandavensis TaxID=2679963 RepID=UPI00247AC20E|nr:hypothetical protein [Pedobacter gandavensis]WGQ08951.1 hypothetical protein QG516_20780 [Pedobacter gandavensis]